MSRTTSARYARPEDDKPDLVLGHRRCHGAGVFRYDDGPATPLFAPMQDEPRVEMREVFERRGAALLLRTVQELLGKVNGDKGRGPTRAAVRR